MRRLPLGIARGLALELDFHHQTHLYLGLYEIELNRYLRELCKPGTRCFDVGGQLGYDALVLAKLSRASVLSFECDPEAVSGMEHSFHHFAGPGPRPRAVRAYVTDQTEANAEKLALDDVAFGENGFVPDLIKLDIEGDELQALRGSDRILRERAPHLVIEVHSAPLEQACGRLLADRGYAPTVVNQRRWLTDLRPSPHNRWLIGRGHGPRR